MYMYKSKLSYKYFKTLQFYILVQMLSTSSHHPFHLHQQSSVEKLYKKQQFTNHLMTPYQRYKSQLDQNTFKLKKQYPFMELPQIKSLLQQLENNCEMVSEIIQDEHKKNQKNMQQEKIDVQANLFQEKQRKRNLNNGQQNQTLRKSLIKLYKKLVAKQKQAELLQDKVVNLQRQNQKLKITNQQLMNDAMSQNKIGNNYSIC